MKHLLLSIYNLHLNFLMRCDICSIMRVAVCNRAKSTTTYKNEIYFFSPFLRVLPVTLLVVSLCFFPKKKLSKTVFFISNSKQSAFLLALHCIFFSIFLFFVQLCARFILRSFFLIMNRKFVKMQSSALKTFLLLRVRAR